MCFDVFRPRNLENLFFALRLRIKILKERSNFIEWGDDKISPAKTVYKML